MTRYRVEFTTAAAKEVRKLDPQLYRVLYEVVDERVLVTVVRVAHRRDVYDF